MAQAPFPAPPQIQFSGLLPGEYRAADGGWLSDFVGDVTVRVKGNLAEAFSVVTLETFALEVSRDPNLPPAPHPRSWQSVAAVNGPGPIAIRKGEALVITVGFACPPDLLPQVINTAVVVLDNDFTMGSLPVRIEVKSI
jgi:hypothetical protein